MSRGVSVVVPTRDEATRIGETLRALRETEVLEVIVADGGSSDGTAALAAGLCDRVLTVSPGRARQMNAGAAVCRGDTLLFLHADTRPPSGYAGLVLDALEDPRVVGGRFDVELDADGAAYRLIETMINLRSRWTRLFTGDQMLFIRRDAFERLGGFPDIPLLEDLALSRAMKRHGRIACLRARARTSARRWQENGVIRTIVLMWTIRTLYAIGVSPERLARLYRDVR